ncbi:MAG: ABC transporter permease [Gordonia sp. (in: high G+C Gram-positive bacteria)]
MTTTADLTRETAATPLRPVPDAPTPLAGIPLSRLIRVELRKLIDTRAGFWLAASIGILCVVVMVAMLIGHRSQWASLNFGHFFSVMNTPISIILPVMAVLLVTGEWSQRTGLTTFTMEPRRERIVVAKLVTALIAAATATVLSLIFGAVGNAIAGLVFGDPAGAWDFTMASLVNSFTIQVFGLLLGFGFAALILNTPGAIVAYFALPTAMSVLTELVPWFTDHLADWVDPSSTNEPFYATQWATGGEWWRLIVSSIIWVAIPLGLGIMRILRSEVK